MRRLKAMGIAVELATAGLTLAGIAYMVLALLGARDYVRGMERGRARAGTGLAPGVSVLKPLKGIDPRMYAGLASHCRQVYAGAFELVFGVHGMDDPAVGESAAAAGRFSRDCNQVGGGVRSGWGRAARSPTWSRCCRMRRMSTW